VVKGGAEVPGIIQLAADLRGTHLRPLASLVQYLLGERV